jgi:outer membrane protein insertion porin family
MQCFNNIRSNYNGIAFLVIVTLLISACKSTKFLNEDESLVKEVKIEFEGTFKNFNKESLTKDLNYLVRQQKNKKFFWIPREYIFFKSSEPGDTSKIDKWVRRSLGEPPSIYDDKLTSASTKAMEQFLRFKKGYFHASVSNKVLTQKKITKITYYVNLGQRYSIKSIDYYSKDEELLKEVKNIEGASLLNIGDGLDGDMFELEKARMVNALQNKGYADFASNYIIINGDSTSGKYLVDIVIEILPPINKKVHPNYKVGEIRVFTDHYHKQDTSDLHEEDYNGIKYLREQSTYIVKPEVIGEAISFVRNELTKRDDRINTYNKLSILGAYRFAEIIPRKNRQDTSIIDYDIQLTPHDSKWTTDTGMDVFNSTLSKSADNKQQLNLLGFGISSQFTNRNLFGGSEKFTADAEASTQLELSNPTNLFRVLNLSLDGSIQYPTFKDPTKIIRTLNKIYLASDNIYNSFIKNATTTLSAGVSSINFRNTYSINTINASLGYKFTDKISRSILLNQIGITYNQYFLSDVFKKDVIDNNLFLLNNFQDNIFTGLFFRNINYNYNTPRNANGYAKSLFTTLEASGFEISALNGLANLINGNENEWSLSNIAFSKYIKFEIDGRLTKYFSGKRSFVSRLNFGIISPWKQNQASPYVKQFNVGGSNSLRAWAARSIGPGALQPDTPSSNVLPFSQGDIKIEANLEYRFNIWWILEGAVFLDVGNVWALKGYDDKSGALFSGNFYKQLAVAGGWGMRWDFNYFNIRFDFGYRVRDPFATDGKNWYNWKRLKAQNLGNIQVAVNYPF